MAASNGSLPALSPSALADAAKAAARERGFELVGIAPAVEPSGIHAFLDWLGQGHAGSMEYLPRRADAYRHPSSVLEGVRSLVLLGMNYRTEEPPEIESGKGRVSRYAWSGVDYHDVIRERLAKLRDAVLKLVPEASVRGVIDTAPLLERDFARLAGLGWFGKNTMLLNKRQGSWFFLAALLTDLDLAPDAPHAAAHCGTCTRCLEACPTDAFVGPYVLDARRCISYLTIEHRGPIPVELRPQMNDWLFGCDICQEVCPWNRKAPATSDPAFAPQADLARLDATALLSLSEDEFRQRFRHTPLARPKRGGILRNACIVLGNQGDRSAVPALTIALQDADPAIRGAAAWALGRLGEREALRKRHAIEVDETVAAEIRRWIDSK